jgi:hypothetical protein
VKKERLAKRDKSEAKRPLADRFAGVLQKLIRRADKSEDQSLFGLLLLIEQKICKHLRRDVQLGTKKLETVKLVHQRRPAISKLSRYVE